MRKKELQNLAKKMAKLEMVIDSPVSSSDEVKRAQEEIIRLSSHVEKLEDFDTIDEMVQDILSKS